MMRTVSAILLLTLSFSLSSAQVKPTRVRVSEGVLQGLLINKVNPIYPPLARQARIQGMVVLQITVSEAGDVETAELFSGHPMLAPAAIEAVKKWKYQPYLLNGDPVKVETRVAVNFKLAADPPVDATGDQNGIAPSNPSGNLPSQAPQRVRVSSKVQAGLIVKKVNPIYPMEARRQHIQGSVLLKASIDKEGSITNLEVLSGQSLLIPAAIEAVRQWKYKPYLLNGTPVEIETQIQVNFTLAPG